VETEVEHGLVSVVLPVFDREATVASALASVLSQTYRQLELLVVDDGSTDSSVKVIEQFAAADPRVRFIRLPANEGRSAARNHALDAARGEFVTFLDSDDLYAPERLEALVGAARRFPGDDIFIDDNMQFAFRDGRPVLRNRSIYPSGVVPFRTGPIWVEGYLRWSQASKLFLRRHLVEFLQIRFPTDLAQAEDYVVLLHVLFGGRARRVIRVPRSLYWYRRPYEARRDAEWLLEQGRKALVTAQDRVRSTELDEMAPRLRAAMEQNPDDGDPRRRFDPRRFTRDRVVFAWCFLWARIFDAPLRPAMRDALEHALGVEEPEQQR
jgi:glycosyltransferase involved in cell wall biosynthesis